MNIGEWTTKWAELEPDQPCIVSSETSLTKKEFNNRINKLSHALLAMGIRKGDRVAVLMGNSNVFLEILFAGAKIGAIVVPLNYRLAVHELTYIINNAMPSLLFYSPGFQSTVEKARESISGVRLMVNELGNQGDDVSYEEWIASHADVEPATQSLVDLEDPLFIMYTSGTTGKPKGAVNTHGNVQWSAVNYRQMYQVDTNDVFACCAPFFHTGGLCSCATPALYSGAKLAIQRAFEPVGLLKMIEREKATVMLGIPTMYQFMRQTPDFESTDFSSVRYFKVGGSPCPLSLIKAYQKKGIQFTQGYGMTEASIISTLKKEDCQTKIGSSGKSMFHVSIRVVDEKFKDVPPNTLGEILVKGPIVMAGYWNNDAANQDAFVDGWLQTGDIGTFDEDGYLYIKDRKKDMYISGGENVYPAEIENVISSMPEVAEVGVVGIPDAKWGEAGLACVKKLQGVDLSMRKILDECGQKLAKYKIPKQVVFMDDLPKTSSGKIVKNELRKQYQDGGS